MTVRIPLTQDKYALIDDEDFELVSQYKWSYNSGYASTNVRKLNGSRTKLYMHKLILSVEGQIDHINGNGVDNRRSNLRPATYSQNRANSKGNVNRQLKSKGVVRVRNKYRAVIMKDQKQVHLGYFQSEEEAAKAYSKAALEIFGEFANY